MVKLLHSRSLNYGPVNAFRDGWSFSCAIPLLFKSQQRRVQFLKAGGLLVGIGEGS